MCDKYDSDPKSCPHHSPNQLGTDNSPTSDSNQSQVELGSNEFCESHRMFIKHLADLLAGAWVEENKREDV